MRTTRLTSPTRRFNYVAHSSRSCPASLGSGRPRHRGCHAGPPSTRESSTRHFDRLRRHLQPRPARTLLPARRHHLRPRMAATAARRVGAWRVPFGRAERRLGADLGPWGFRPRDWLGPRRQADVDVRGRAVYRVWHEARGRMYKWPRDLRPRESRVSQSAYDPQLHGRGHRDDSNRLPGAVSAGGCALMPLYLLLGTVFGFILSRSGAADYGFIQGMFLFTELQLYGVIGVAVIVAAPGIWLIKRRGRTIFGRPVKIELKALHRGNVVGGVLFGVGWSLAGMCPGPILVNIGEGKVYALAALAGALVGAGLLGSFYPVVQRSFGLPQLKVGTGEG